MGSSAIVYHQFYTAGGGSRRHSGELDLHSSGHGDDHGGMQFPPNHPLLTVLHQGSRGMIVEGSVQVGGALTIFVQQGTVNNTLQSVINSTGGLQGARQSLSCLLCISNLAFTGTWSSIRVISADPCQDYSGESLMDENSFEVLVSTDGPDKCRHKRALSTGMSVIFA